MADRAIAAGYSANSLRSSAHWFSRKSRSGERADLLLARERFLNANNATLTIVGGVARNRAIRALRQLLGPWRKSEQIVPTTFRQPLAPDQRTLILNAPTDQSVQIRLATRGLARSDRDSYLAAILGIVAASGGKGFRPKNTRRPIFVRHEAHVSPDVRDGSWCRYLLVAQALKQAREVMQSLISFRY